MFSLCNRNRKGKVTIGHYQGLGGHKILLHIDQESRIRN